MKAVLVPCDAERNIIQQLGQFDAGAGFEGNADVAKVGVARPRVHANRLRRPSSKLDSPGHVPYVSGHMPKSDHGQQEVGAVSPHKTLIMLAAFALAGVIFAGVSSYDFIAHLDRQVHAITCSIVPGIGPKDASGASGCHTVLMSPYSSVLRDMTWGGIPIALPALGVFAFLLFRALDLLLRKRMARGEAAFLVAATALPVLTSIVYGIVSATQIGTFCKVCVGIYVSSLGVFVAAIAAHVLTSPSYENDNKNKGGVSRQWGFYFVEGLAMVALPVMLYLAFKPAYPNSLLHTSGLRHPDDKYGVMLDMHSKGQVPAVEVMDPLCPACKAFSERLTASGLGDQLQIKLVLFPLDKDCNWMVGESLHAGACAVSEALLCAGDHASKVLNWAFANQEDLRARGAGGQSAVYARIKQDFPDLASCVGQPAVRARVNKGLRWIVANSLPVLTPQLFVRNQKLPDEDTDLGLDYVLSRALAQGAGEVRR
jgi:uncharacterized membrane protein